VPVTTLAWLVGVSIPVLTLSVIPGTGRRARSSASSLPWRWD